MSGGVDSSVAAALLREQGYQVVGVYMKNWTRDLPGMVCPWETDFNDAKRVAVQLGIDFRVYDFQKQYRQKVVDYMLDEYRAGRTPNPDVMCNQEMKFKLFLDTALGEGADMIATGHYARVAPVRGPSSHTGLFAAMNKDKDQTYFLYRVSEEALARTLFPLGEFKSKNEVRAQAKKFGLATADKKDSQGICFVGKIGIKDFILNELGPQEPGAIIDQTGREVGEHEGAIFYTIGQRHGLGAGGGLPYYVTGKNMQKNEIYVTTNLDDNNLWGDEVSLTNLHWISGKSIDNQPNSNDKTNVRLKARTRHRAPLISVTSIKQYGGATLLLKLTEEVRAISPGQSVVIYDGDRVAGGGIITNPAAK